MVFNFNEYFEYIQTPSLAAYRQTRGPSLLDWRVVERLARFYSTLTVGGKAYSTINIVLSIIVMLLHTTSS